MKQHRGAMTLLFLGACAGAQADQGDPNMLDSTSGSTTMPEAASSGSDESGHSDGSTTGPVGTSTGEISTGEIGETGDSSGTGELPELCGNGVVDMGEACDKPNGIDADGCNEDCTLSGSVLWSSTIGGSLGLAEDFFGIAVDEDANAYATGALHTSNLGPDLWIQSFNPAGVVGWDLSTDGSANGLDAGRGVLVHDGSLYVAGKLEMTTTGDDWRVGQYSLLGAEGWTAAFSGTGVGDDAPRGIASDASGRLFVSGREFTQSNDTDVRVHQYLEGGLVGWTATHDGAAHGADGARAVAVDADGNVVVAGFETVTGQGLDGWVGKYDPDGALLWSRTHRGAAGLDELASGVATDSAGNVYAVGYETVALGVSAGWVQRWDADGSEGWLHTWRGESVEGSATFLAVAVDGADNIVVAGSESADGASGASLQKLDTSGSILWSQAVDLDDPGQKRFRAVAVGPGDHIWAAGRRDLGVDGDGFEGWVVRVAP